MTSRLRSSSVGAAPRLNPLSRSRAESAQPAPLEVRCGCQFFQSDSLLPERINPIGSRPNSRADYCSETISTSGSKNDIIEEEDLNGSILSFGVVTTTDYYAEVSPASRPTSRNEPEIPTIAIERPRVIMHQDQYNMSSTNRPLQPVAAVSSSLSNSEQKVTKPEFSSQRSLDRYSTSVLLQRYRTPSRSRAPSLQGGSSVDVPSIPKMTKTVSFDYGRPSSGDVTDGSAKNPIHHSNNYMEADQYHRMSPMVFPVKDRLQRLERTPYDPR